jgi:hypothetical protein
MLTDNEGGSSSFVTEQRNALINTMKGVGAKKYMNPNLLSQRRPMLPPPLTSGLKNV